MVDQAQVIVSIYRNGSAHRTVIENASGTGPQTFSVTADVFCASTGDYFELYVRQTSGSAQTISGLADETYFMAALVR